MAQPTRAHRLLARSEAALMAAIEIYNKPDFGYREESFAILAINAWELLLKAKILHENGNRARSIQIYESRLGATGIQTTKLYLRKNRSGNPQTITIGRAVVVLDSRAETRLPKAVKDNLDALLEIRDNAIHHVNASPALAKRVLEIGTAAVKNYLELGRRWFGMDLSKYKLYLMPIGFVDPGSAMSYVTISTEERRLLQYLLNLGAGQDQEGTDCHVALEVKLSFKRAPADEAIKVVQSTDPGAIKVSVSEEDIRQRYPWDYDKLTATLNSRYVDFKRNERYHEIRKPLEADERYAKHRYLDPSKRNGLRKVFYNSNIVAVFDGHYTRR